MIVVWIFTIRVGLTEETFSLEPSRWISALKIWLKRLSIWPLKERCKTLYIQNSSISTADWLHFMRKPFQQIKCMKLFFRHCKTNNGEHLCILLTLRVDNAFPLLRLNYRYLVASDNYWRQFFSTSLTIHISLFVAVVIGVFHVCISLRARHKMILRPNTPDRVVATLFCFFVASSSRSSYVRMKLYIYFHSNRWNSNGYQFFQRMEKYKKNAPSLV